MQLSRGKKEILCVLFGWHGKTPCRYRIRLHILQQNFLQFL
jgi:hypothetical protein